MQFAKAPVLTANGAKMPAIGFGTMNVWLGAEQYDQTQYAISSQTPLVSLWNTTVIAFSSTFLAVAFGSVLAYGVSRYRILSEARMTASSGPGSSRGRTARSA